MKKTTGVKAVNPLAARASLQGPTYVETGKPYQYKATINDVVSGTVDKSYVIKGYWILPDGSRVDGVDLEFTPRKDDKLLSFYTYVDGYPEETSVSTLAVRTWDYTWPVEWRIKLIPQQTDVPATVKYSVETPNFDIKSLNGEQLTYTWSLPDGITRTGTSSTDVAGTLTVNKHGTFQVAVQVADTRGNAVNISSEEFTILPPASVKAQMTLTSKYGEEVFAPGSYYVGLKLLEVPRGDQPEGEHRQRRHRQSCSKVMAHAEQPEQQCAAGAGEGSGTSSTARTKRCNVHHVRRGGNQHGAGSAKQLL